MTSKTRIEFKTDALLSDFLKVFMQSENSKELFHCMGHDGVNYYIDLNVHCVENGSY